MTDFGTFFGGFVVGALILLLAVGIIDLVATSAGSHACEINTGKECKKEWRPTND